MPNHAAVKPRGFSAFNQPGKRIFINRNREKEVFRKNLQFMQNSGDPYTYRILTFYGVGGMGKSKLCSEFTRMIDEGECGQRITAVTVNFDDKNNFPNPKGEFLDPLRYIANHLFRKYKYSFRSFDLAYAYFWKNTYKEQRLKGQNWLENSEIVSEIVESMGEIPVVGAFAHIARAVTKSSAYVKDWWEKKENQPLKEFLSCEDPRQDAEKIKILYFFAHDLMRNVQDKNHQLVIFLDTYERLLEHNIDKSQVIQNDAWVRDLIRETPGVLWSVTGRQPLRWAEVDDDFATPGLMENYEIRGLSEEDADHFLKEAGIHEVETRKLIIHSSQTDKANEGCYPYYLELALDLVEKARNEGKSVDEKLLGKTANDLSRRFLMWMNPSEISTMKVLSVPRYWDDELAGLLIDKFKTGYAIIDLGNLKKYSFVSEGEGGWFRFNSIMQQSLLQTYEEDIHVVHEFLAQHYDAIAAAPQQPKDIMPEHEKALNEAYYHFSQCLDSRHLFEWIENRSAIYLMAEKNILMTNLFETFIDEHELEDEMKAEILFQLAEIYGKQAKYLKAINFHKDSLALKKNAVSVAKSLIAIGMIYQLLGKYDEAGDYYSQCRRKLEDPGIQNTALFIDLYDKLGRLHYYKRDFNASLDWYQRALQKCDSPEFDFKRAELKNNVASTLLALNRLDEAETIYHEAYEEYLNLLGEKHPEIITIKSNLGSVNVKKGDLQEAEKWIFEGLTEARAQMGEDHPRVISFKNNLATLYRRVGKTDEAYGLFTESLAQLLELFGESHDRVAMIYNNLSWICLERGELDKSKAYLEKSLEIRKKLLGDHSYGFIQNIILNARTFSGSGHPEIARELLSQIDKKNLPAELRGDFDQISASIQ